MNPLKDVKTGFNEPPTPWYLIRPIREIRGWSLLLKLGREERQAAYIGRDFADYRCVALG